MSYPIPRDAFDDRLAIVGTAGSGKTYLTMGAMEHLFARGARVIGVDPLGVMWGLRLCEDGKTASPFQPVLFGGAHGDLPINEHAGALIGETVATMRESCIIDLSQLGTKAAERRFMLAFLTALYRSTNKEPVHLIIDEADMFAPQKLLDKDGDAAKLLGMMETIVRRGRVKGFIPWLITQRPAVLSKDVLSQADALVALKLTSSQDRAAIGAWIEGQADRVEGNALLAALPSKQRGEAVLWIPARGILRSVEFPPKATYDSSRTPKRGEARRAAEVKPIDIGALRDKLTTVADEAKANDPRVLRAENAKLSAELAKLRKSASLASDAGEKSDTTELKAARAEGRAEGITVAWEACEKDAFERGAQQMRRKIDTAVSTLFTDIMSVEFVPTTVPSRLRAAPPGVSERTQEAAARAYAAAASVPSPRKPPVPNGDIRLGKAERAILSVLAHFPKTGAARNKVALLAGYSASGGGFGNSLSSLRTAGLLAPGEPLRATDAGLEAIGEVPELPTGERLLSYWKGHSALGKAERAILEALARALPGSLTREDVAAQAGYAPDGGGFGNALSCLRTLELISGSRELRAAEEFA